MPETQVSLADTRAGDHLAEMWARVLTQPEGVLDIADAAVALQPLAETSTRDGLAAVLIPNGLELDVLPEDTQALVNRCRRRIRAAEEQHDVGMTPAAVKARLVELCCHATDEHAARHGPRCLRRRPAHRPLPRRRGSVAAAELRRGVYGRRRGLDRIEAFNAR